MQDTAKVLADEFTPDDCKEFAALGADIVIEDGRTYVLL